jgi:Domain of unknown function (DUF6532)
MKTTQPSASGKDSDIEIVDAPPLKTVTYPLDEGWHPQTHLKYPVGSGKINIMPQNKHIQHVACGAIQNMHIYVCFKGAFPDPMTKIRYNCDTIYNAANDLGYTEITNHIQLDLDYTDILAGLVSNKSSTLRSLCYSDCSKCSSCIRHLRGEIKDTALASVPGHYSLSLKSTSPDVINALLLNDTYLYPCDLEVCSLYIHYISILIMHFLFFDRLIKYKTTGHIITLQSY